MFFSLGCGTFLLFVELTDQERESIDSFKCVECRQSVCSLSVLYCTALYSTQTLRTIPTNAESQWHGKNNCGVLATRAELSYILRSSQIPNYPLSSCLPYVLGLYSLTFTFIHRAHARSLPYSPSSQGQELLVRRSIKI